MAIKKYKPTSPGLRSMSVLDYSELTKKKPEKSLTESIKKTGGRNTRFQAIAKYTTFSDLLHLHLKYLLLL